MPSHRHKGDASSSDAAPQEHSSRPLTWRLAVPVAAACAGLLATTSMFSARGTDLRAGRSTDLIGVVGLQRGRVEALSAQAGVLQEQVDALAEQVSGSQIDRVQHQLDRLSVPAGTRGLVGPGLVVTLDDATDDQEPAGDIDPNLLIVHQQDIQAVVNALWAGGAEGLTLQGQRIVSTTGVKCVGNTVLLQGVPYSPPYRVVAVGDVSKMYAALVSSPEVQNYRDYVGPPYNLGWSLRSERRLALPGYSGPLSLQFASPVQPVPTQPAGD